MIRRRTLVITDRADFFIPKLLASVALDAYEPLPIDVLRYGFRRRENSPYAFTDQVPMLQFPQGVREFTAETLDGLDALFEGYGQIAVYSVNPGNANLINHLVARYPQEQLSIICSDDEIERHWRYQNYAANEPNRTAERDAELRSSFLYPPAVEQAFEGMRRWFIGRRPWETMLRKGRHAPLELIPHVPPILNRIAGLQDVARSDSIYRVVLFPKPSVGREHFKHAARSIAKAGVDKRIEIVSFRNDMPTLSQVDGGEAGSPPVWQRCYPYPIDEASYHRVIAAAHGLVLVPRGGLSTIRDAVRYGLDLVSMFPNTPNELAVTKDMGLRLTDIHSLDIASGDANTRRDANRAALARYEYAAISAFRATYCAN